MDSLTLKVITCFKVEIVEKPHTVLFQIFKLQYEVLKFTDVYVSWRSPKLTL